MLDPFEYIPDRRVYRGRDDLRSFTEEDDDVQPGPVLPEQSLSDDPLNYDFDMCEAPWADDTMSGGTTHEARWRDPATVAAMRAADPRLQNIFELAGFGSDVSDVDLPAGQYLAQQDHLRHDVIVKLTQYLSQGNTAAFDWGQINRMDFFKAQAEATPLIQQGAAQADHIPAPRNNKRQFALIGLIGGFLLIGIAVAAML